MRRISGLMTPAIVLCFALLLSCEQKPQTLEDQALQKIEKLEELMSKAQNQSLDVTREETTIWFAQQFIKFANWDEANRDQVEKSFGYYRYWADQKEKYANELPDFERQKVIEILDTSISQLEGVIAGDITRPAVRKVQWGDIEVAGDLLLSNGKPVFLHDYFSKTVGQPLTNDEVYNDHLGKIFHGGENLYDVHQDRAINPWLLNEDGTFNEDKLKLLTDIEDTSVGFLYFWNSGLPDWLHEQDSNIAAGRSLFLGFDIDNPLVRDHWGKIAQKAGELTAGKKVTQLGYVIANEPHWFAEKGYWTQKFGEMNSISDYTLTRFQGWLSAKYKGRIDALNDNWRSSFKNFNEVTIEIPMEKKHRGKPMWFDWCRYSMDRSVDWFTHVQKELKATNPEANTHVKLMARYFREDYRSHGLDFEALTDLMDIIGDDAKAMGGRSYNNGNKKEKWENRYSYYWEEIAFSYDFMESVSPNKIHVNSETHFLSLGAWRDLNTSVDYTRSVFWLATLHGMDAGISWFWARDPDGSPEDRLEGDLDFWDPGLGGAYAGSVNMQPQTANEVAQVYYDMNSVSEELYALRNQKRPLRLFYSETSAINKKSHLTELFDLYESLYFEGFPMGYATEKIIKKQDNSTWDAILVYSTEYATDAEFEAVQSYLNQGGRVIIDNVSLSKNEYGKARSKKLKSGKGEIIAMGQSDVAKAKSLGLAAITAGLPPITLEESNGTEFKGCTWRVVENPEGGFWVNILNLGKNSASLTIGMRDGSVGAVTNMMTQEAMGSSFDLKPSGVLLLSIESK